jgi:hypothetical protein
MMILRAIDPIAPTLYGEVVEASPPASISWIVLLCLDASIALMLIAAGQGAGRHGDAVSAMILFWIGITLLLVPIASRIAYPVVNRGERLFMLILLGGFLFLDKSLYSPSSFEDFDDLLHWITANDILYYHRLFLENQLLPVSAYYSALEIITTSLSNLSESAIFPASLLVIAVLRVTFIVTLFLFFEKITESSRIAAIGCLIYMGSPTFIVFGVIFSYESLAIVLCILAMLAQVSISRMPDADWRTLILPALLIAILAVSHHMTSFWYTFYMIALTGVEALRRDGRPFYARIRVVSAITLMAIVFPVVWMQVRGNPIAHYMEPVIRRALTQMYGLLYGRHSSQPRELFVGADGNKQPIGNIIIGISATLIIAIALSTGFFRSLALTGPAGTLGWHRLQQVIMRRWSNPIPS